MQYYDIQPIQTKYSEIQFKSKLEAQTALFFDLIDLDWQYEPRQFNLGEFKGSRVIYTPDFYIFNLGRWIEVKGPELVDEWIVKAGLLAKQTNQLVQIWQGSMGFQSITSYLWRMDKLRAWKSDGLDFGLVEKSKIKNGINGKMLNEILWKVNHWKFETL